ncbi:MAG: 3-oxoacyl-ACP synthase III [Alphaproteobacteria bacterium]|nr:3-oxoacyl-ACP synthase III [Alphaproteobacteria bacterium]
MRFQNVCIEEVGYVLPPNVVTSAQLEAYFAHTLKRLGMPPGQVEKLSGIKERRWWDEGVQPSTVAAMAGQRALDRAGLTVGDIQSLINCSVSRDWLEPATSAMVAGHLGCSHEVFNFDVGNACVGFLNGLYTAACQVELGHVDRVLVTCGEVVRNGVSATLERLASPEATIDTFRENFATLTLGAGAVAAVVTRRDLSRKDHRLNGAILRSAPERNTLCLANHTEMRSDAHGLLVHGVGLAVEAFPKARAEFGWGPDTVDEYVCHQVSVAHFTHAFEQLGLPLEKATLTLPYLGNCGPCSLPLTLCLAEAQGRIQPGQELCLWAVGSGLGCIVMSVSW